MAPSRIRMTSAGVLSNLNASGTRFIAAALLAASGLLLLALIYWVVLLAQIPSSSEIRRAGFQRATVVYSSDGRQLANFGDRYQIWVSLDRISAYVPAALIATEDRRFFEHQGIDVHRTLGSILQTLRGHRQGGSTITMQLARNAFPDLYEDTALTRKLKEWVVASRIEALYSKAEILEAYLNTVPFMYNAVGIEAGARTYFRKAAAELKVDEAAMLVGMLKGTAYYNPTRHPDRAHERRNVVLTQMVEHGDLKAGAFEAMKDAHTRVRLDRTARSDVLAPHFVQYLRQWLSDWAEVNGFDLENGGLSVYTTIDSRVQRHAEQAVRRVADDLQTVADVEWSARSAPVSASDFGPYRSQGARVQPFSYFWKTNPDLLTQFVRDTPRFEGLVEQGLSERDALDRLTSDESFLDSVKTARRRVEAGLVVIDARAGGVVAWVGGRDFATNQYDHVAVARRQPGSTFKPIVYAAAFEHGYSPDDRLLDEPVAYTDPESGRTWSPEDVDRPTGERMTLSDALAYSKNTITARLVLDVGPDVVVRYAHEMGIESELETFPSIGLGTSEVSLLELAGAYGTLANGGLYREPIFVTRIEDPEGRQVATFSQRRRKAVEPETAHEVMEMLHGAISYGTGTGMQRFAAVDDLGGKTGTSQNGADGWFVLVAPDLVAAAWVGFDSPAISFRSDFWGQGAHTALPIVGTFYRAVRRNLPSPGG